MKKKTKIDWNRLTYGILSFVLAALLAYVLQPKFHDNKDALAILVNVFAILAGFLIAIMALVDSRTLQGRSWKEDTIYLETARRDLLRHRTMFKLYLLVLIVGFFIQVKPDWPSVVMVAEYGLLFFGMWALLMSLRLPTALTAKQLKSLEDAIRKRKTEEHRSSTSCASNSREILNKSS